MQCLSYKSAFDGSWTRGIQSETRVELVAGAPHAARGVALLWYSPQRRLSISVWCTLFSFNLRLWGPKHLSF